MTPRPGDAFMDEMRALEGAYLASSDPIVQSGFSGGPERWRAERSPLLAAVSSDGDLLDVGCANGYLLECLLAWALPRRITPHGLDLGAELIRLARTRMPDHASNFHTGDAFSWEPPQQYDYVYSLTHLAPPELLGSYVERLLTWVRPGGRLILGDYGSRSRGTRAIDVAAALRATGHQPDGESSGGEPVLTRFAWITR